MTPDDRADEGIARLIEREKEMRNIFAWLLGEHGEFPEEPPPLAGKYRQRFYWRSELRHRLEQLDKVRGVRDGRREEPVMSYKSVQEALLAGVHKDVVHRAALEGRFAGPDGRREEPVRVAISELRAGEENDGPLESTDLFLEGRGISLLVNVEVGGRATYSLSSDGQPVSNGWIAGPDGRRAPDWQPEEK